MDFMTLAQVALPLMLGALMQGTTGFGFNIIVMLFLPSVYGMTGAAAFSILMATPQCLLTAHRYRDSLRLRYCLIPWLFYVPVDYAAVSVAASMDMDALKPFMGLLLIVLSAYFLWSAERKVVIKPSIRNAFLCAGISGVMEGFFAIGGPLMVLYFASVLDSKEEYLGTIQTYMFATNVYNICVRAWKGEYRADMLPYAAFGLAAVLLGVAASNRIVGKIDSGQMKKVVYAFIGVAGLIIFAANII